MRRRRFFQLVLCVTTGFALGSAPNDTQSNAIDVKQSLDRLAVTGSVLMIAAHPDDENTGLISYLARGRKVRTAYLSLTRGEGGQNVIGPEQGADLGILRTEELLQSRRVDGGQQFFSRAIDFGYSKSAKEALDKWGHDAVLGDIVWVIRSFRPDVVILQFTGTSRDGHGQHQASAILGREAYEAAGDPKKFPEQLKYVQPWHPTRLMVNRRGFTKEMQKEIDALAQRVDLEIGGYDPLLGYSYGELAGISRSLNSSQSDGTPRMRGDLKTTLVTLSGPPAKTDLFDGVNLTWSRYPGGEAVGKMLAEAASNWKADDPTVCIEWLIKAREAAAKLDSPEVAERIHQIDETIAKCAGLWLDFSTDREQVIGGSEFKLKVTAIQRTALPVVIESLKVNGEEISGTKMPVELKLNEVKLIETPHTIAAGSMTTQPYWLQEPAVGDLYQVANARLIGLPENPPLLTLQADVRIGQAYIKIERPVLYRYMDRLHGESVEPVAVMPPASLRFLQPTQVFPALASKKIEVEVNSHAAIKDGRVSLEAPAGWKVEPASEEVTFTGADEHKVLTFEVTPERTAAVGDLKASLETGGRRIAVDVKHIDYPHIPLQTLFPPSETKLVRADTVVLARRVGYVMGAGDDVPAALLQLGCSVSLLSPSDLAQGDLSQFDAIVTGIRAYTERPDLAANQARLMEYVSNGGTLVVQYNRIERDRSEPLKHMGPYPFEIGSQRVTVEEAPVVFDASNPLLSSPNRITEHDFDGWVQERGLYFASKWDAHYETPFEMHDPGDPSMKGSTLVTRYGKGVYIFTALSFFRELPAGVPGAYRLFANFLSASKTLGATAAAPTNRAER
jgi:LmbE family N-acetylglucosaminyl deacetylase